MLAVSALSLAACTDSSTGEGVTSREVRVFPSPGTPTASAESQISLRGVTAEALGELSVEGSSSGAHNGSLVDHSDGHGVSFVPDRPFEPGESVTVGSEHRVHGGEDGTYTFAVARAADIPTLSGATMREPTEADEVHRFVSEPDLHPPLVTVTEGTGDVSDGLVAIGADDTPVQMGPMLVDAAGDPVFFRSTGTRHIFDTKVQHYRGDPVLTWWEGFKSAGYGEGEAVILDQSYEEIARVQAANGYPMDLHEFELTEEGTALVIVYDAVLWDLTEVGGSTDAVVLDGVVQEIDIATGAVLFEWHALGSIGLEESYAPVESDDVPHWDWVHLNSVEVDDDGHLLISARDTCAVYKLDRESGEVIWRLGGENSDFEMGEGAQFARQHDARRGSDGTLSVFDNGWQCDGTRAQAPASRGLVLTVDEEAMTAAVAEEYRHPEGVYGETRGSFQQLSHGRAIAGWGSARAWSEFTTDGELVADFILAAATYRAAWTDQWQGTPSDPPAVVLADVNGSTSAFVSWNGATEVASWRVVDTDGQEITTAPRDGFETEIDLGSERLADRGIVSVQVEALTQDGSVLGTSGPVEASAS